MSNESKLKRLDLSHRHLALYPELRDEQFQLETLNLSGNQLTSVPESLGQCTQLTELDLSGNRLVALPESIGQLVQLRRLILSNNRLSGLPESIGQLSRLQTLDLFGNRIITLPESIGRLVELEELDLSGSSLTSLPNQLRELRNLKRLFLHGNDRLALPQEILGPNREDVVLRQARPAHPVDILAYYFETQLAARPLNEVKLVIVGRGGVGKSSIREQLVRDTFDPMRTEAIGIQIDQWSVTLGSNAVRINVWDFGGLEIFYAFHQFFFTERCIYLLVLEALTEERDAEYWLRLISAFGKDSPVIIALNKWDQRPFDVDRFAFHEKYPAIRGFIPTDCKTGRGINELKDTICTTVDALEYVHAPLPALWVRLKNRFSEMTENYLAFDSFRKECAMYGENDPGHQEQLAQILHALGVIMYFADDPRLRHTMVLNPRWVTNSIYKLLRHGERPESDGTLTLDEARDVLPDEKREMVLYLIDLMQRFELCFPIDEEGKRWLVPELLSRFQPPLGNEWLDQRAVRLRYEYKMLPEGLMPRLIARTYPLSANQERWRNGVVLAMQGARALVRADVAASRVNVTIIGEEKGSTRLAKFIRNHFHHIHRNLEGFDPKELVGVEGHRDVFKSVKVLEMEMDERLTTVESEIGSVRIDQTRELNRISSPAARNRRQLRLKLFLSYSYADRHMHDLFTENLALLEADGLVDSWFDGRVSLSTDWDTEIRRELEVADIVVFLVSSPFLASSYIRGAEMERALERRIAGEAEIVSVLLEDCLWKGRPFTKYLVLPPGGKSVRRWKRYSDAFNIVEGELRKLISQVIDERLARGAG
jgi:internalin A